MELENINAEWARKRGDEILFEKTSKYLKLTLIEIGKAVESGKTEVTIDEWIPTNVVQSLKQKGFDVIVSSNQHDGYYTKINW